MSANQRCSLVKAVCSAERVGADVAAQVGRYWANEAALGPYLADQWVLPLAIRIRVEPSR